MQNDSSALVSVIVPICNVERFLEQALESIQNQTHENLEIICINDGSKDSSLEIIQRFAAQDERFIVVDKANEGYGATCNLGIGMARGEWISIIEPDDWIEPNMYAEMLSFVALFDERVDIVKTPWTYVCQWDDPQKQYLDHGEIRYRIPTSRKPFTVERHPILIEAHPAIWSALYRRDFLNEKHIRFMELPGAGWADNPFLIETMCQADSIVYLDEPFYFYRTDLPGSTLNHGSDEAVARPFDRWLDMMDIIERLNNRDRRLLDAHYLRGFNYVTGAMVDDGWDNPVVQRKTREVFSRMDKERVLKNPKIRNSMKRFYLEVTEQDGKVRLSPRRLKVMAAEAASLMRRRGIKGITDRVKRRLEVSSSRAERSEVEKPGDK